MVRRYEWYQCYQQQQPQPRHNHNNHNNNHMKHDPSTYQSTYRRWYPDKTEHSIQPFQISIHSNNWEFLKYLLSCIDKDQW